MRALLLPIKDLTNAKQRLRGVLSPQERFEFAQAMLADTLHAVRAVKQAEKIFVVTNYPPAVQFAEQYGWEVLREAHQISESVSVDWASQECVNRGVTGLLRLPLDLPLVQAQDIDDLLGAEFEAPALVIVPSRDGTGTNAILRCPPALFPSHFGEGSFAKHCAEAERVGARTLVRRNSRVEMDVDDVDDLKELLCHDLSGTESGKWLRENLISNRVRAFESAEHFQRFAAQG